jgi:hypothetical protein
VGGLIVEALSLLPFQVKPPGFQKLPLDPDQIELAIIAEGIVRLTLLTSWTLEGLITVHGYWPFWYRLETMVEVERNSRRVAPIIMGPDTLNVTLMV